MKALEVLAPLAAQSGERLQVVSQESTLEMQKWHGNSENLRLSGVEDMIALAGSLLSLIIGAGGTRASMALARAWGILDLPGEIKIHRDPTPRFGGFGIVVAVVLGYAVVAGAIGLWSRWGIDMLVGGLVIAFTGAVDDIRGLRPMDKLLGQLVGGIAFVALSWSSFAGGVLAGTLPALLYAFIGVLFVTFMSNGLNLLDGLDGLAAGATAVMASFLTVLALFEGKQEIALTLGTLVGACIGFLIYNVPPAKTFMGDIGSLFLGYMVAAAGLQLCFSHPVSISRVLGILLILAVPIVDASLAILRRLLGHRNIFSGDRLHLYDCIHRQFRGDTWRTLGAIWGLTFSCGVAGVFAFFARTFVAAMIASAVILGMAALASRVGSLWASDGPARRGSAL